MMSDQTELSLEQYANLAARRSCNGRCNGKPLPLKVVLHHAENPYGWPVKGFKARLWLSAVCPECGYANSFWSLGIPGSLPPTPPTEIRAQQGRSSRLRMATLKRLFFRKGRATEGVAS